MHLRNRLIGDADASAAPTMDDDARSNDSLHVEASSSNSQQSSIASQEVLMDNPPSRRLHQTGGQIHETRARPRPRLRELRPKPRDQDYHGGQLQPQLRLLTSSNATPSQNTPFQSESEAPWSPHNYPLDAGRRQEEMKRRLSTDTLGEPTIGDLKEPEHSDKAYSELQSMEKTTEVAQVEENTMTRSRKRQKKTRDRTSSADSTHSTTK